ncbi:DGQHR domain-containing protein [Uliginosibacterium sp. 31-12]|uniref:DGQHR domain-containing protein n=1 Tax=Uliginosibacterium sp. 31-12 TaxID=3062781 RepID=UPI0026E26ABB|nr:DGQHR domain-containing protein [Uliginosibacterium sp. 31-12]MDO6387902.1 DGQHR domain-containing protein [Uliginosibacterium sp. 31-12]
MFEISVFPIEQPGGSFYYSKIKTKDIVGKLNIRRRSVHADGVQRDLAVKRIREISDYLSTADAILPTPLVISVPFAELRMANNEYYLMIPTSDDSPWGEIIDGQHRYEGLRYVDNFNQYEIPVCIFIDLSIEDKATVFSTINSTQVKVPKSYIYDLFDYTDSNTPAKFCHEVCKTLNYDKDGPLSKRVKMLGRKLNDSEVLSQAALVDAIIPLISKNEKLDEKQVRNSERLLPEEALPLRQLYIDENSLVFSKILRNYFLALREVSEHNWESYALRSIGVKVFLRVLGLIARKGLQEGSLSQDFFFSTLYKIKPHILACTTEEGTNKRAEDTAVERLSAALGQDL